MAADDVSLLGKQVQNAATEMDRLQTEEAALSKQLKEIQASLAKVRKEYSAALYGLNQALGIKGAEPQKVDQPRKNAKA